MVGGSSGSSSGSSGNLILDISSPSAIYIHTCSSGSDSHSSTSGSKSKDIPSWRGSWR